MGRKGRASKELSRTPPRGANPVRNGVVNQAGMRTEERLDSESLAFQLNPMDFNLGQSFVEEVTSHSRFGLAALRGISRAPYIIPIIKTRVNQTAEFSVPQPNPYSLGFDIIVRGKRRNPSTTEKKEAERIREMILTSGLVNDPDDIFLRDDFETFLRKIANDSLVLDGMAFEVIENDKGEIQEWAAVDASTIFRTLPKDPYSLTSREQASFVQVVNDVEINYFTAKQMAYCIRNPSTELALRGYGRPELVDLMQVMLNLAYASLYNQNYFKQGGQKGVMAVMGDMTERQFESFKRMMVTATSGVRNAYRLAMVNPQGAGADIKWVPIGSNNRDMEFSEWINWNYKIACAVYQIAPEETGFYYGNEGEGKPMFESSQEAKIRMGKSKGLRPFLRFIQKSLNKYIIHRINPDFDIEFLGLESMTEQDQAELNKSRVTSTHTLNEIRAEMMLPSLGEAADIVLDPTYLQRKNIMEQMSQQEEVEDGEEPGADGGEFDDEEPDTEDQGLMDNDIPEDDSGETDEGSGSGLLDESLGGGSPGEGLEKSFQRRGSRNPKQGATAVSRKFKKVFVLEL